MIEVKDGGTIEGTVTWAGTTVPVPVRSNVTRDHQVCDHALNVKQDLLVDAATRGVANAVVYIKDISAGKPPLPGASLDNRGCLFEPHVVLHPAGTVGLAITNSDPDPVKHNTHLFPTKNPDFNRDIPRGPPTPWGGPGDPLRPEGPKPIACDMHAWMSGWYWIVEHPYYVVSDKQGRFALADIPPGTYALHAWHEWTGPGGVWVGGTRAPGKPVTVPAKGSVAADLALSDAGLSWK
ncbi:MAG: carboxypeptidase regulatory-like domain-containing protein [Planctomycetales bacterium]|nr:carboxypeptidase regulatory-like domain-containing protein [Planctomycetales bacterium]